MTAGTTSARRSACTERDADFPALRRRRSGGDDDASAASVTSHAIVEAVDDEEVTVLDGQGPT
jgi:hypothetical protein